MERSRRAGIDPPVGTHPLSERVKVRSRGCAQGQGFPGDRATLMIETGAEKGAYWEDFRPGIQIMSLFEGAPGNYKSALMRFRPGASLPAHIHLGDEHVYVLTGCQEDEYGGYEAGGYISDPIGTAIGCGAKKGAWC